MKRKIIRESLKWCQSRLIGPAGALARKYTVLKVKRCQKVNLIKEVAPYDTFVKQGPTRDSGFLFE